MLDQATKNKRMIGMILFFIGSIIAISAAAKMPEQGAQYPSTVGIFIFALGLGIIGNMIWHKTEKAAVMAELELHKNDETSNPVMLLEKTVKSLEKLNSEASEIKGMDLCHKIDEILDTYVYPFTEKRKIVMDLLGQANGAEVLLIIAYAERMLNRVWSASADGHHEEAMNCLQDSLTNYQKALIKTQEYSS